MLKNKRQRGREAGRQAGREAGSNNNIYLPFRCCVLLGKVKCRKLLIVRKFFRNFIEKK